MENPPRKIVSHKKSNYHCPKVFVDRREDKEITVGGKIINQRLLLVDSTIASWIGNTQDFSPPNFLNFPKKSLHQMYK